MFRTQQKIQARKEVQKNSNRIIQSTPKKAIKYHFHQEEEVKVIGW